MYGEEVAKHELALFLIKTTNTFRAHQAAGYIHVDKRSKRVNNPPV